MHDALTAALTWALGLKPSPAALKLAVAILGILFFGLVLFALTQYQTSERRWGMKLVFGLLGGAMFVGVVTAAFHWVVGALGGVGYLLTWLVWVLTRRWCWWRRALARGLTAGLTIGPWLWLGETEKVTLTIAARDGTLAEFAAWLVWPNALMWFWMSLGFLWLLLLVGGWGCWRWPLARPEQRRRLVTTWAVLSVLGLNGYVAGRVDLMAVVGQRQPWHLGYRLVSRPGSQWYRNIYSWTPLHVAAMYGRPAAVRLLLAAGADVNAKAGAESNSRARKDRTPLHWAAEYGHAAVIRLLLAAGTEVNSRTHQGETPLSLAARFGHTEALRVLLAAGADVNVQSKDGETPLRSVVRIGCAENTRLLLAAGADANIRNGQDDGPLDEAISADDAEDVRLRLAARAKLWEGQDDGPLHVAISAGHVADVRLLLAAGANPNATNGAGKTPLRLAIERQGESDKAETMRLLLAAGARPNTALQWAAEGNDFMWPSDAEAIGLLLAAGAKATAGALYAAARWGGAESVRLLLAAGANANARFAGGETPLHLAAGAGEAEAETLRPLLAAGANVNARTEKGETPLHRAAASRMPEALRLLLAAGAEVNARNQEGETPLHRAARWGQGEAVRLLLAAGADVMAKDKSGVTPLHSAPLQETSAAETVRLLLAAGAEVNATTNASFRMSDIHDNDATMPAGATPLHCAARFSGATDTMAALLAAGAKVNARTADGATALDLAKHDTHRQVLRDAGGKTGAELDAEHPAPPK